MPTDPSPGATLPLLALLRSLCAGDGCHPCPDGVTLDYLVWAGGGREPEDRVDVACELSRLYGTGRVARTIDEDGTALWSAR